MDISPHTVETRVGWRDAPRPPPVRPQITGNADTPQQWHRGMTLIATVSLFIGTRSARTQAMLAQPSPPRPPPSPRTAPLCTPYDHRAATARSPPARTSTCT
ncbi:hypothetical protein SGFS_081960 [Streptomyces graminofaciens]|uniref:Transposase n=1 Tax=Streptomyces graminofaciens TaxID=68212 RepID=A0ABN5VY81_9ACTN|nr:hypothetical protein SGFS_081960 [Streptomyces graminofaciens]